MSIQRRRSIIAQLDNNIAYHKHQTDYHNDMADYHNRQLIEAGHDKALILATTIAPPTYECTDILGNLVASGTYVPASKEYVTNRGKKVAHWNASLYKIVPVALLRARLYSQNRRADPAAHARYLEQQRQRYAETHPAVRRRNPFVDY